MNLKYQFEFKFFKFKLKEAVLQSFFSIKLFIHEMLIYFYMKDLLQMIFLSHLTLFIFHK